MKSEAGPPSPNLPRDTRVKVTLVARPLLTPAVLRTTLFYRSQQVVYLSDRFVCSCKMLGYTICMVLPHFKIMKLHSAHWERKQTRSQTWNWLLGQNDTEHTRLLCTERSKIHLNVRVFSYPRLIWHQGSKNLTSLYFSHRNGRIFSDSAVSTVPGFLKYGRPSDVHLFRPSLQLLGISLFLPDGNEKGFWNSPFTSTFPCINELTLIEIYVNRL
jgi:hypothetical protein